MTTVTCHQPGTSVVFVQQPQIRKSTWARIAPAYLLNGIQVRKWRVSFNQLILCLTTGIILILCGTFLIGRGTTNQGFWPSDPDAPLLDIGFGSTMTLLGGLMIVAFLGMCCFARNKYNTLKESGVQDTSTYQDLVSGYAPNCHVVVMP